MPMFLVNCRIGRFVVRADTHRRARVSIRQRYGSINAPYRAKLASPEDLVDHLRAGAKFFEQSGEAMSRDEAFSMAGLAPITTEQKAA